MSDLTRHVGHDLHAPLRVASGYLGMLREDHGARLDADALHLLDVAERQLQDMDRLLDALLLFSQAGSDALQPAPTAMAPLVAECAALATADGGVRLEIDTLDDACCDRFLVRQVWRALLDNAYRFTRPVVDPVIAIGSRRDGAMVRYTVRDNGIGFDRAGADRLFAPFVRLHAGAAGLPASGAGIGLAVARRIIERHGGSIEADSRPQCGAAFSFTLPAAP